jgi:hypothetical protein
VTYFANYVTYHNDGCTTIENVDVWKCRNAGMCPMSVLCTMLKNKVYDIGYLSKRNNDNKKSSNNLHISVTFALHCLYMCLVLNGRKSIYYKLVTYFENYVACHYHRCRTIGNVQLGKCSNVVI